PASRRRYDAALLTQPLAAFPYTTLRSFSEEILHMKRRTKIIIGIVVLVVAGVLTAGFASRRGKDITPVTYGKVARQDLTSKVSANGRIDAKRKVDLSANV